MLAFLTLPFRAAHAELVAFPAPLRERVAQAAVVVVARVLVVPDRTAPGFSTQTGMARMAGVTSPPEWETATPTVPPPPTFVQARVLTCFKGQIAETFRAKISCPTPKGYLFAPSSLKTGDTALFFLRRSASGPDWEVADGNYPALRLTGGTALFDALHTASDTRSPVLSRLVPLLIASLSDAETRPMTVFYLSDSEDSRIVPALLPYVGDPDWAVRDYVLIGLATNQYAAAIPLIVKLAREEWRRNRCTPSCIDAIAKIRSPQAIAALNRLLLDESLYTRLNAMMALRPLADQTSIPYLMTALRDPEPQHIVSYDAYAALNRLAHLPGELKTVAYFEKHRSETTKPLYHWYANRVKAAKRKTRQQKVIR